MSDAETPREMSEAESRAQADAWQEWWSHNVPITRWGPFATVTGKFDAFAAGWRAARGFVEREPDAWIVEQQSARQLTFRKPTYAATRIVPLYAAGPVEREEPAGR